MKQIKQKVFAAKIHITCKKIPGALCSRHSSINTKDQCHKLLWVLAATTITCRVMMRRTLNLSSCYIALNYYLKYFAWNKSKKDV